VDERQFRLRSARNGWRAARGSGHPPACNTTRRDVSRPDSCMAHRRRIVWSSATNRRFQLMADIVISTFCEGVEIYSALRAFERNPARNHHRQARHPTGRNHRHHGPHRQFHPMPETIVRKAGKERDRTSILNWISSTTTAPRGSNVKISRRSAMITPPPPPPPPPPPLGE